VAGRRVRSSGSDFLLYGATGYTGRLIARRAAAAGMRPLLAGRDATALAALAAELDLPHRAFRLDDAPCLAAALETVPAVLNCAGPFTSLASPLVDGCIRAGRHYLDISGEVTHHQAILARDAVARHAGAMLLPGCGFDLVPTDCLAAHVAGQLPGATTIAVASQHLHWRDARGRSRGPTISRGTAATLRTGQLATGLVRLGGRLVATPLARGGRAIDLGSGPAWAVPFPMAELVALHHSTAVPDVTSYLALPRSVAMALRYLAPVLRLLPLDRLLRADGPSEAELAAGQALIWAEATDDRGNRAVARLRTAGGYAFTALACVELVRRVLAGDAPPGYQTPSSAYGADLVLALGAIRT
jgi:short subunit dehydrogenase-like uncharacterized protein